MTSENPGGNFYYSDFLNCPDAAFHTAALTLDSRAASLGKQSPYLADWIHAQDAVFSNCSGKSVAVPNAAPDGSPALLRADRAYQLAAAAFYAGKYEESHQQFEAIAQDKSSSWRIWGEYLSARALVRKAFSQAQKTNPWSGDLAHFDLKTMQSAQQALEQLLKHHDPAVSRQTILNELNFVRIRTEPDKRVAEICAALSGPSPDPNFRQDLNDLNYVLYKKLSIENPPALYAWISAIRSSNNEKSILATWQQNHTLPWLTAAMATANPSDASVPELLAPAAEVESASPAYDTITFHRIRLLTATNHKEEARSLLDEILPRLRRQPPSSALNAFLSQRMAVARNFSEFLTYAPRTLLDKNSEGASALLGCISEAQQNHKPVNCQVEEAPLQFAEDATVILNSQVPLNLLIEAANSSNLPANLRQEVTLASWVRSVLLNDAESAAKLLPLLPESVRKTAGAGIGFPAVFTILHNPGLQPYFEPGISRLASYGYFNDFHDNWWCNNLQMQGEEAPQKQQPLAPVAFLSSEDQKVAEIQRQRLMQLPCGPAVLGQQVVSYAQANPSDPNIPEALALVVRASHYGRREWGNDPMKSPTTAASKAAFQLLHTRYPKSPWTTKTPYYY